MSKTFVLNRLFRSSSREGIVKEYPSLQGLSEIKKVEETAEKRERRKAFISD